MTTTQSQTARDLAERSAIVEEIERSIGLIAGECEVIEIRALDVPGKGRPYVSAGYFDRQHWRAAAQAAYRYSHTLRAKGVYMTLNPCNPALLARSPNTMTDYPPNTTTDGEILGRDWLFIDIDPHRPSGVAASEAERQAAAELAEIITEKLRAFGFPYPLFADSGNGQYLLYKIDLPNDDASTQLIRNFYIGLNSIVPGISGEPYAEIDRGVYNAARIARIGGTMNRKGGSIPDRPHRQAHISESAEGIEVEIVPRERIEVVAAKATGATTAAANKNGQQAGIQVGKIDVPAYLGDYGVKIRETKHDTGRAIFILETCPFDSNHGSKGESSVMQAESGLTTFHCKHGSCQAYKWQDFKARVGKLEPRHLGKAEGSNPGTDANHRDSPLNRNGNGKCPRVATLAPGTRVYAGDRGNIGEIVADNGDTCIVHFVSPEGQQAEKELPKSQLRSLDGHALVESDEPPIPPPCSLRELVLTYPAQREPVIDGLLRVGETMNIVAAPKKGKSWLGNSLALSIASGCSWLDTFPCARGRVLLLDAELHPEVIAHRLPDVANAMGLSPEYLDFIDVLPLRGLGIDLLKLKPLIESIKPGHYALVILDAWYRFLPLGFSENDNAQVMALYNQIDAYAGRLKAAWVNIHHASKGDQSGKGTTDVGSGAGSQSRAADTHLVIRQHEQEDVAVIEAVVRSWPPVERFAVRWSFPTWQLDGAADPRKLLGARAAKDRANRENKDVHLSEDRQAIVNVMMGMAGPETKTFIRDSTRIGNPRFGYAWASLITDGTIATAGKIKKGNNQSFDAFVLSHQEDGDDASG